VDHVAVEYGCAIGIYAAHPVGCDDFEAVLLGLSAHAKIHGLEQQDGRATVTEGCAGVAVDSFCPTALGLLIWKVTMNSAPMSADAK
jgi:hypothetical protein